MTLRGPSLFDQLNRWPLSDVAARLGLNVQRRGGAVSAGPCPLCGAVTRHTKTQDKRGALGWRAESQGWKCFQCEAHGDGAALVAAKVCGTTNPPRGKWAEVERHCGELGLLESVPGAGSAPAAPLPPPRVVEAKTYKRTPAPELLALWEAALPLTAVPPWDADVRSWGGSWCGDVRVFLTSRGLDPLTLAGLDVARILPAPERYAFPAWWLGEWPKARPFYRLAALTFDATGEPVCIQARDVADPRANPAAPPPRKLKTNNPEGFQIAASLFADALGREVLRGSYTGPGVVIVEGLTDFLSASQLVTEFRPEARPAVLGVVSGSAAALEDVRLPEGVPVNVLTDDDRGGDEHAQKAVAALWRKGMRRLRPPPIGGNEADLTDWLKHDRRAALAALSHGMEVVPYVAPVSR